MAVLTTGTLTQEVRSAFPDDVADVILNDPRWEAVAEQITSAYQGTPALAATHIGEIVSRLERHTAVHTWLAQGAYTPARWLARNLNV